MDFYIKDKIIKFDKKSITGKIVGDNSDYIARFIFDEEWDGKKKTVRFINNGKFVDVILDNTNSCEIPIELMKRGRMEVGVFAGNLHTTTAAAINITPSILETNGFPADPSPDVYNQIMDKLDNSNFGPSITVKKWSEEDIEGAEQ